MKRNTNRKIWKKEREEQKERERVQQKDREWDEEAEID